MTAGERLLLIGGAGPTGEAWRRAARTPAPATAGELLVIRSGLGVETAAVHHLYDPPVAGGSDAAGKPQFMKNIGRLINR